jgi:hypothetical protein
MDVRARMPRHSNGARGGSRTRGTGGLHAKVGWLIPEAALWLASLLIAMEAIELELGPLMDKTEPIPPVFPQEPAD